MQINKSENGTIGEILYIKSNELLTAPIKPSKKLKDGNKLINHSKTFIHTSINPCNTFNPPLSCGIYVQKT